MPKDYKYPSRRLKAISSLFLLTAFVLLGFCPLRNALAKLVETGPPRTAHTIPEYGKINAGNSCENISAVRPIAQNFHRPFLPFAAILSSTSFVGEMSRQFIRATDRQLPKTPQSPIPIYLRNCLFRI